MTPADERETVLFREALQQTQGPERDALLDQTCAGNPALRSKLEALLQSFATSHHNGYQLFLFEPGMEPGMDAQLLAELEAGDAKAVIVHIVGCGDEGGCEAEVVCEACEDPDETIIPPVGPVPAEVRILGFDGTLRQP
jgi:hypothetical protein